MTAAPHGRPTDDEDLTLLRYGRLTVLGRLTGASNTTLYCEVTDGSRTAACVYKPVAGSGRCGTSRTAHSLDARSPRTRCPKHWAGTSSRPPSTGRTPPHGPGMVQLWIAADTSVDLVALARDSTNPQLRLMAVFDAVINNSDRKIGHLLPTPDGHLYGCDHGVSFSAEYKLRTVLWQWAGQPLPEPAVVRLDALRAMLQDPGSDVARVLARHLTPQERYATLRRVEVLCEHRIHPYPPEDWPALPWPPI